MWLLAMFDVPTVTTQQKRDATRFRNLLLDHAFTRVQWSVYGRYLPNGTSAVPLIKVLRSIVPDGGAVCVLRLTETQWATADRYIGNRVATNSDQAQQQLALFL